MGIVEFLRKKFGGCDFEIITEVFCDSNSEGKEDGAFDLPKFAPLSMYELVDADWDEFGKKLKRRGLLPPSYDTKNAEVDVDLDKNGLARACVTFRSKTSSSVRRYDFYQAKYGSDKLTYEWINGVCRAFDGNVQRHGQLDNEWCSFMTYLNIKKDSQKRNETRTHVSKGEQMYEDSQKLQNFYETFINERKFIEEHKDDIYEFFLMGFGDRCETLFTTYSDEEKGENIAIPFTPKTLEFCVSRLNHKGKLREAVDLDFFKAKCQKIKARSMYETADWDKVIEGCVAYLSNYSKVNTEEKLLDFRG